MNAPIDWKVFAAEMRRFGDAQNDIVKDRYAHPSVKSAASTAGAVMFAIANSIEAATGGGKQP
jgi:hypothetical protein